MCSTLAAVRGRSRVISCAGWRLGGWLVLIIPLRWSRWRGARLRVLPTSGSVSVTFTGCPLLMLFSTLSMRISYFSTSVIRLLRWWSCGGFAGSAEIARVAGRACRRTGRFMVHTSPGQHASARFQAEVLGALGKHWDRAAQGGNATTGQLAWVWLRAERARDLIVLRAHQISGPALIWLLSLPVQEYLRLWLISPQPLPGIDAGVVVTSAAGAWPDPDLAAHDETGYRCEDLSHLAPASGTDMSVPTGLTVGIARRLRLFYDIEAAAWPRPRYCWDARPRTRWPRPDSEWPGKPAAWPPRRELCSRSRIMPRHCCVAGPVGTCCRRSGRTTSRPPT
jgi:hypothetical protein